jgi:hypothetical protein
VEQVLAPRTPTHLPPARTDTTVMRVMMMMMVMTMMMTMTIMAGTLTATLTTARHKQHHPPIPRRLIPPPPAPGIGVIAPRGRPQQLAHALLEQSSQLARARQRSVV